MTRISKNHIRQTRSQQSKNVQMSHQVFYTSCFEKLYKLNPLQSLFIHRLMPRSHIRKVVWCDKCYVKQSMLKNFSYFFSFRFCVCRVIPPTTHSTDSRYRFFIPIWVLFLPFSCFFKQIILSVNLSSVISIYLHTFVWISIQHRYPFSLFFKLRVSFSSTLLMFNNLV